MQLTIERLGVSTQLTIDRLTDSTMTPSSELVRNAIDDVVYMGALIGNQIVQNLVHNAVASGDEGGHVAVLLKARDGAFALTVVDEGPGVLPTELPRL